MEGVRLPGRMLPPSLRLTASALRMAARAVLAVLAARAVLHSARAAWASADAMALAGCASVLLAECLRRCGRWALMASSY